VPEPISDEELLAVRTRKQGYWDGSIVQGLIDRIDAAERQLEAAHTIMAINERAYVERVVERDTERMARWAEQAERDRLRTALEKVMDETGTSSLAHHAARDALTTSPTESS
jgi:hypothetical protein